LSDPATIFSPDAPEVRMIAQLAGIPPLRLAGALSDDPDRLVLYMTGEDYLAVVQAVVRLGVVLNQLSVIGKHVLERTRNR
jgi:hypothetical protein